MCLRICLLELINSLSLLAQLLAQSVLYYIYYSQTVGRGKGPYLVQKMSVIWILNGKMLENIPDNSFNVESVM